MDRPLLPRLIQLTFAIALGACVIPSVQAQRAEPASPDYDRGWFTIGLGPSITHGGSGVISANFGRELFMQVAIHADGPGLLLGGEMLVQALSVAPGYSRVGTWARLAVAAGPAFVWGEQDEWGERDDVATPDVRIEFGTVGVVASAQAIFTPVKEMGLGLNLHVNLNLEQVAAGVAIVFVLEGHK